MMRFSRSLFFTLAVFLSVYVCAAMAQQPAVPSAPASQTPAPRRRAPRADKPFELHALTPEFWKLFDKKAKLETMGTGFGFTEGPVWDPAGFLWVSDELNNRIVKLYEDGHIEDMVSLVDPDGSTYDRHHRLLSTASGLRAVIRLSADGKSFETVVDHYQGKKLNTPNDIVIGPDGAVYFTDPTSDMTRGQRQELPQSVYRMGADNSMTPLTTELKEPNGLAFSPNGKYLYIDDDYRKNIRRYKFHKDGTISDGMDFGDMHDPVNHGVPDGMKVDKKGHLFVSGPNGIWVWNSKGVHIGTVQMPHGMANLTWGGPNYSKLYITAGNTVYILQTKTRGILGYLKK
ncbi:MAG TPA: SMP-30/gluconolactonase/LRE family protein [Acidobacteriaceae bacterium]|jgi:gluconolactonase|nr:SMP-30/gluconolactonase/LRE family protein [Acidobacteriaceae bacterium]